MLEEALEHLGRGIVDHPDDVVVRRQNGRRGEMLEVRVHPHDHGRVNARSGRTPSAQRTVVGAQANGRSTTERSTLNTAVLPPMPSARVTMTVRA